MPGRITRRLLDAAVVIGAVYIATFLIVAVVRAAYPFEVEWMEGGMLTHAARLLISEPIYVRPSTDFVPFFYTPGYPTLLAGLSHLTGGLSFTLGRIVSLIATAYTMGLLFHIVRREAGSRYGLLSAGIYAALFRFNGAFYDLVRPDALFLAIALTAIYVAYAHQTARGAIAAALLCVVAFFTKQTSSVFTPAIALYLLWRNWRHAVLFIGTAIGLGALGVWLYDRAADGWFWTFIFEGHQGHLFYWKNILIEYWRDLLVLAPILILLPLLWFGYKVPVAGLSILLMAHWTYAFVFRARTLQERAFGEHMYYRELLFDQPRWIVLVPSLLIAACLIIYRVRQPRVRVENTHGYWLWIFVAGAGASALNHSTQWAYSNCFMPLSVVAAILIALAVRDLVERAAPDWSVALIPAALVVQLVALGYDPVNQVPGEDDYAALDALDARLDAVDGPIFMPAHPYYGFARDRVVHTHQMGIQDVAFMGGVKDLDRRLAAHEWAAVVVDESNQVRGLARHYTRERAFRLPNRDGLRAKTGFLVRPRELWVPKKRASRSRVQH